MKYEHLLSPIKINDVVLKNRMISSNSLPHFLQGPEEYPTESIIKHLSHIAKNGAAIVTFADWSDKSLRGFSNGDICRFPVYNLDDPTTANYMNTLTDMVHLYGSKISLALSPKAPQGYGVYENKNPEIPEMMKGMMDEMDTNDIPPFVKKMMSSEKGQKMMFKMMSKPKKDTPPFPFPIGPTKELTEEQMKQMINNVIKTISYYKDCGFDMVTLHMAYRSTILAQFLSPLTNKRTDKYGGSMENRARFPLMMCKVIKEKFGKNFLIEVQVSGEDGIENGVTIDDIVEFAKLSEGLIDILQLRSGDADLAHPTNYNSIEHKPITLKYAEAIKNAGINIVVEPIGGYQNPDDIEEYISSGKADMIGMARSWICDFDYGEKIISGRGEDVVPCIRCNKCHGVHMNGPWRTVCSVNPRMGLQHYQNFIETPKVEKGSEKKIAIIGGGPAGMFTAIELADKGHYVTIYEASDKLGGALKHSDYVDFKWTLKNYKNYLIEQVMKRNIDVKLNTSATRELLSKEGYDVIISSMGSKPIIPNISGLLNSFGNLEDYIYTYNQIYGKTNLGENIIVIGGGDVGIETSIYLAEQGYRVKVISNEKTLAPQSNRVHYYSSLKNYCKNTDNFEFINKTEVVGIKDRKVICKDKDGKFVYYNYDSIVVCCGSKPLQDEALLLTGITPEFYIIGDNRQVGSIESSIRSAYGIVNAIKPKGKILKLDKR